VLREGFPDDSPGVLDLFLHLDGEQPFLAELPRRFHLREGGDFSDFEIPGDFACSKHE
jgi:hypothetical protein